MGPRSAAMTALPQIDHTRCVACGECVRACPRAALQIQDVRPQLVSPEQCDYCGVCEAICSKMAITCPYEIVLAPIGSARSQLALDDEEAFDVRLGDLD